MNIAFFLTPKNEVVYATLSMTIGQVLEYMENTRYTAIPIIDDKGKYVGTLTEGDLLWKLKSSKKLDFDSLDGILVKDVPRNVNNKSVFIDSNIEDLLNLSANQNFVPVVDDNRTFIGIIKRSDIINYFYTTFFNKNII
ncbi:CBS domain-containing protein [Clostridium sp. PL3]|uniref:CBS domain-containing protein n=1 Tax=Clostridium thailandense TaxID=2794346 RepID=A0A949X2Q8_9CLOT|nr:CBS domain-containing protein [Clostridium thailandense]MBV7273559.1 CBS domain-containing protein [Clostridium thailandense]